MSGRPRGKKRLAFVGFTEGGVLKEVSGCVSPPGFPMTAIIFGLGDSRTEKGWLMPKVIVGQWMNVWCASPEFLCVCQCVQGYPGALGYSETLCLS